MGSVDFESIRRSARFLASVLLVVLAGAYAWAPAARARGGGPSGGTQPVASGPTAPPPSRTATPTPTPIPTPTPTPTSCVGADLRPTRANLAAVDAATACLIDRARSAAHLRALRANPNLQRVAARQSREMVLGDYFGDDSRSGQTPLQRIVVTRYLRHTAVVATAQNIGWGTDAQATPAAIVAAWMCSPPHREIVLTDEFRDIGVGASPAAPATLAAGHPGATYTVEFGVRQ